MYVYIYSYLHYAVLYKAKLHYTAGAEPGRARPLLVALLVSYSLSVIKLFTLLDSCVSSLRRGHANLLCIVPILTDDPRRES